MSETNHLASSLAPAPPALNESQRRAILFCLLDLHRRLAEMESLLVQGQSPSPLSQYVNDLSLIEIKVVRDYFERLRARILACLQEAAIPPEIRRTGLRWALQVNLSTLLVTLGEMTPKNLAGYGHLSDDGRAITLKVREDLTRLIDRVGASLRQGLGGDMEQRLARLEASPADVTTLTALDRVITRRGMVEFRPQLETLVRRLESPQFEVAVFGRVSSGKSSLLNHLVGAEVLPVGVTPVTAVPARLVCGDRPAALISFAEIEAQTVPVQELREYASEEGNPGNHKHVTNILVQLPSARLREGVVLVDTPGIGSLALSGSAETFAYLPRCDLGVVLIDSASTLTPDDLALLRRLYEAAIPAQVVLSKADLLSPADRQRTADYVREQAKRELCLDVRVHPVSTVGTDESLLTHWFEEEIEPLLARHRTLAEASLRRKASHLRESVIAALETLLARRRGAGADGRSRVDGQAVRRLLGEADEAIRQARERCREWKLDEPALLEVILTDAAKGILSGARKEVDSTGSPLLSVIEQVLAGRDQMAHALVGELQEQLSRTLETLGETVPSVRADAPAIRDVAFRGLPAADLSAFRGQPVPTPPWWAPLSRGLAVRAMRRRLENELGLALREQVRVHDRQLQAWLRTAVGQLVELYDSQAEVFREQARLSDHAGGADVDLEGLEADLRELREMVPPWLRPARQAGERVPGRPTAPR